MVIHGTVMEAAIIEAMAAYLEARLDRAARELVTAERFYKLEANEYTHGRFLWCRHQFVAIKQLLMDTPKWRNHVARYEKRLKKRAALLSAPDQSAAPAVANSNIVANFSLTECADSAITGGTLAEPEKDTDE